MAKKTLIVASPKVYGSAKLDGDKKAKMQELPIGHEVEVDESKAKKLIKNGLFKEPEKRLLKKS